MTEVVAEKQYEGVILDHEHPWPGLVSFTEANQSFFFGREREVNELARLVRQETLTVFFGKSGLGKSSVLRAGLSPLLRKEEFVPIYIRLNHAEAAPPLEDQVKIAIEEALAREQIDVLKPVRSESLWEYFHKRKNDWWDADNRLVKPVLIFDQFEELLTLGQENPARAERTGSFLSELEDLIENRPPAALTARFKQERDLADQFDHRRSDYRVILSLREDFLPDLEGLRERLSPIMLNRLRLLPMSGAAALDVILKAGRDLVDEETAIRIVDFVSSSERSRLQSEVTQAQIAKRAIEPALLSVVLQELNSRRVQAGQEKITPELVGKTNPTEIFHDFYVRGLQGMDGAVREFIEDSLLTSSGARNRIAEEDALTKRGISAGIISKLIDRRVIQRETTGATKWLELTHDTLADVVRADRATHQQQRQLALAGAREAEARQKLRRAQKLAAAFAGLLIAALLLSLYAAKKRQLAENAQKFTTRTVNHLATGILREIEQNPRIRVSERKFLAQRLSDAVESLQKEAGGPSDELSMQAADLLATASLMLLDGGLIDDASNYARRARAILGQHRQAGSKMPLVVARVELAFALSQSFTWQIKDDEVLALLDEAEAELGRAKAQTADGTISAEILKARLAWARSDALRSQTRYGAADNVAVSAISEIEKTLNSGNAPAMGDSEHNQLRILTYEMLRLFGLRFRIAVLSGKSASLDNIHANLEKAIEAAKSRFPGSADDSWKYFEAKNSQVGARIAWRDGSYDSALAEVGSATSELYQLLADDPDNLLRRYELGIALCLRAEIAKSAGGQEQKLDRDAAQKLVNMDRQAARKLAITIRRDQQTPYLSFQLACLSYADDDPADAASFLARVRLEKKRFGSRGDLEHFGNFAHQACLKVDLNKKLYPAALKEAEIVLAGIDRIKFTKEEAEQRANGRLDILGQLLLAEADKLGRDRWLAFYDMAQKDLNVLHISAPESASTLSTEGFITSLRAEQYMRDRSYREAIVNFKEAADKALGAIAGEQDQRIDFQNYLYFQNKIFTAQVTLTQWNQAEETCRSTRACLSKIIKKKPKIGGIVPYVELMTASLESARKSLAEARSGEASETKRIADALSSESRALQEEIENLKHGPEADNQTIQSISRIDLEHFKLDDFRSGKKDDYLLVKQRIGWEDAPVYPAAWRTVTGKEFDEFAALVARSRGVPEKQVQRVRISPLNFYEECQLVEAEYVDAKGDLYTVPLLAAKAEAHRLDGTSPPIHSANASIPLQLHNAEDVAAYLRFFCAYVRGELGAFQIVENTADLPWATAVPSELKNDVGRILCPLVVWPDPEGNGDWRARATVQYSNAIFHADFKVQKGGMVEMLEDRPVASDMPFYLPVYKNGDRSASKLEGLDLRKIGAPKGENEVDSLLSMAESENNLEFATEAIALQAGISSTFGGDDQASDSLGKVLETACEPYTNRKDWQKAIELQKAAIDSFPKNDVTSSQAKKVLARPYLGLSWCQLMQKDFSGALASVKAGLELDSDAMTLETNRAHALLLLGRTGEAEQVYRKYIGQKISAKSETTWEEVILDDLKKLEDNGIASPEFERIRKILKKEHP